MSHSLLKGIRSFGLVLFLIGLFTFSLSLFLGTYRLTEDILTSSVQNSSDRDKLSLALKPMMEKPFSNQFDFVGEYQSLFNTLNATAKSEGKWGEVIYADYSFIITKNSTQGFLRENQATLFFFAICVSLLGALLFIIPQFSLLGIAGIKNNGVWSNPASNRSWLGFLSAAYLIGFYMFLYFYPEYITGWVLLVEPVSMFLSGKPADQWFLYGFLYTAAALVMGVRMFTKYRHSNYQLLRTASVMFFQSAFAFLIPEILKSLNLPSRDLKNIFPLDYSFFYDYNLNHLSSSGTLGLFMLFWGVVLFVLGVPIMTYFFGKRWYCSWVCGCGGLAETLGDPYRQLSDKSLKAWKVERILIHSVLVFSAVLLTFSLYSYFTHETSLLGIETWRVRQAYGFLIGAVFSGVVGTGFYPVMGSRVWCRFGCPLAAYLGIIQRFKSRFRITTNGGQCISCGNCSTYCEMGIDVRAYAQRGENIVRSSCVGCGVCAAVCPRGVLSLENGPAEFRLQELISYEGNRHHTGV